MSMDDERPVVLPRSLILSELAKRDPASREARVLAIAREVLGPHAECILDDGAQGLMLICTTSSPGLLRHGFVFGQDEHQICVINTQVLDMKTGALTKRSHEQPLELRVCLESLREWCRVAVLD